MNWPPRDLLIVPAVDWRDHPGAAAAKLDAAPRLAAQLGWLLQQLRAYGDAATVGFYGATLEQSPELAARAVEYGCELAAMTWDAPDPWALPPGALRDQVENTIAAARAQGLAAPTRFLPPFPANQALNAAQVVALREAGVTQTIGCLGDGLAALPLATLGGRPLAGAVVRFAPVWLLRAALARSASRALCLSPVDVDPGAPAACGPGRGWLLRRLPGLLAGGFAAAAFRS